MVIYILGDYDITFINYDNIFINLKFFSNNLKQHKSNSSII